MITGTVLDEPELGFGTTGTHVEQRRGVEAYGPADVAMEGRRSEIRLGIVGPPNLAEELAGWITKTAKSGARAKDDPPTELFPAFPGCSTTTGFLSAVKVPKDVWRPLTAKRLAPIKNAATEAGRVEAAVAICAEEVRNLHDRASVDVVMVIRPEGVPAGVPQGAATGADFHDLLKAELTTVTQPVQIIRPATWRGASGVEDQATIAWNLFAALYYKAGGKPWRLLRPSNQPSRCYVGVSFTQSDEGDRLMTSVAQVFNELGDGVIVRGGLAERSASDRQPHLSKADSARLLSDALAQYKREHLTLPAAVTLHKTSAFSQEEIDGFHEARDKADLSQCELVWLTTSDGTMLVRGSKYYPPLRGTLLSLSEDEHVLYTHGSVPYYRTYPGLFVPRTLGIRPATIERSVEEIATEILALSKLNWNRARLDGKWPITLLTARRVGSILRHVPKSVRPAPRYANYM